EVPLQAWASQIFRYMKEVCALLDEAGDNDAYFEALTLQREKLSNPEMLPSARVLAEMRAHSQSFFRFALDMSSAYRSYFLNQTLTHERKAFFEKLAQESVEKQRALEAQDKVTFSDYLERYFRAVVKG
ncbi:MAG: glutamate--cysteine ligase, partial [Gammaproteobacteria bacterium]